MNNRYTHDDTILLKIHRQYSEKEAVAYLEGLLKQKNDEIAQLKFKIGELNSENSEIKDSFVNLQKEFITLQKQLEKKVNAKKEWNLNDYTLALEGTIKKLNKKASDRTENVNKWRNMYFDILAKYEKIKLPKDK